MRNHPLKLDDFGISWDRYKELLHHCRQYDQLVARRNAIRAGFNDLRITGMPRGNQTSDPTAQRAVAVDAISGVISDIEQSAIAADSEIYQYILSNATRGIPYEHLICPCGRRQFYEARRRFFAILDRKRESRTLGGG